jgi:hypothetical protein
MRGKWFVAGYRLLGGVAILVAIGYQLSVGMQRPGFSPTNFFSFFTILSNLLAAVVLLWGAAWLAAPPSPGYELVRGAAVVYMTTTLVVFALLLSGIQADLQLTAPWVNTVLHEVMPIVMILDWLVVPARPAPSLGQAMAWLAFPIVWLAYTLIRGPIAGWYPYPFLDPAHPGGYGSVAVTCAVIAVGMIVLCAVVAAVGAGRAKLGTPAAAT